MRQPVPSRTLHHLTLLIGLVWVWSLFGCGEVFMQANTPIRPNLDDSLCANERLLLQDSIVNWEVPLSEIDSISEFFRLGRARQAELQQAANTDEYQFVHPYLLVDSIRISLFHLLRPTGAGYISARSHFLRWDSHDLEKMADDSIVIAVRDLYQSLDSSLQPVPRFAILPKGPITPLFSPFLKPPMISIIVGRNGLKDPTRLLRLIAFGYIQGIRQQSQLLFGAAPCDLDDAALWRLRRKFPLRIRLLNGNRPQNQHAPRLTPRGKN